MPADRPLDCADFVELVTDYLEAALREADRLRMEQHRGACRGCAAYLRQVESTILVLRRVAAAEPPSAGERARMLATIRDGLRPRGQAHVD